MHPDDGNTAVSMSLERHELSPVSHCLDALYCNPGVRVIYSGYMSFVCLYSIGSLQCAWCICLLSNCCLLRGFCVIVRLVACIPHLDPAHVVASVF